MLAPAPERLEGALDSLSPGDRALLELSLRRQLPDEDIASFLSIDAAEVERRRGAALGRVAYDLEARSPDEAAEALSSAWTEEPASEPIATVTLAPEEVDVPPREEEAGASRRKRSGLLLLVLALAAIAALVVALAGGGGDPAPRPSAQEPAPRPAPAADAPRVALQPVAGARAAGSIAVRDGRLNVRLDRVPAGSYTLWLYDSVSRSAPLARFRAARGELDARLPADASRYRYLDISREPADGNPGHSGASVLRAPVADVLRAR